ncbi:MAG TPA: hypothetical protein VFA20_12570 [Myxococcaceae bacterium]|nr:hypothetical protein [Myxococcaceae bacterium]
MQKLEAKPETYSAAVWEETILFMPIQLTIDGVQLLELENVQPSYLEFPLLGFCASLNRAVDKIKPGVRVDGYLAGGGELRFREEDGKVRIWCTLNNRVAHATRTELVEAARKFRDEVRDWFLKNAPALQTHEYWAKWFPKLVLVPPVT